MLTIIFPIRLKKNRLINLPGPHWNNGQKKKIGAHLLLATPSTVASFFIRRIENRRWIRLMRAPFSNFNGPTMLTSTLEIVLTQLTKHQFYIMLTIMSLRTTGS